MGIPNIYFLVNFLPISTGYDLSSGAFLGKNVQSQCLESNKKNVIEQI